MSNYNFLNSTTRVSIIEKGNEIVETFPGGVFSLKFHPEQGSWFDKEGDIRINLDNVYGDHVDYADLFYKGYCSRDRSTGVLLTGLKGTGKTLISKILSRKFIERGLPVILIDRPLPPSVISDMLGKIETECMIIIDEFEKNFEIEDQNRLLSFLDGTYSSKRMVVVIANDVEDLTPYILDRPNRMLFRKHFSGLTVKELNDFLDRKLGDELPGLRAELINYVKLHHQVTYDIVNNIVEVCKLFDCGLLQAMDILNIPGKGNISVPVKITLFGDRKKLIDYFIEVSGNYDDPKDFIRNNSDRLLFDSVSDVVPGINPISSIVKNLYLSHADTQLNVLLPRCELTSLMKALGISNVDLTDMNINEDLWDKDVISVDFGGAYLEIEKLTGKK